MMLTIQRRLAADVLNCAPKDVRFEEERLKDIKEAITKVDIRSLIKQGFIGKVKKSEASRARARVKHTQKVAGKQKGHGSRKGTKKARGADKTEWMNKVRSQRDLIKELREKTLIAPKTFRELYSKVKGGFFRNKRHIKLYISERDLLQRK